MKLQQTFFTAFILILYCSNASLNAQVHYSEIKTLSVLPAQHDLKTAQQSTFVQIAPQLNYKKRLSYYKTKAGNTIVECYVDYHAENNPFQTHYQYDIEQITNGYLLNPKALLSPHDLYHDKKTLITQEGSYLFYPTKMEVGDVLLNSQSKLLLNISNLDWNFYYEIENKDRAVRGVKTIIWNSKPHTANLIQSTLCVSKYLKGKLIDQYKEKIIETYISGYGPVEIERTVMYSASQNLFYQTLKL